MATPRYTALRGTRDLLPEEASRWRFVESTAHELFARFGFEEIRTPVLESLELFTRSVGAASDIVAKQMYTFQAGDEAVCLRPENTAPVVRAFVEHALYRRVAAGFPERLYYIGPMFRHERPQKGRYRQFHQIGVEVLGAEEPLADAETLHLLDQLLRHLGIPDGVLVVNSVGDANCRPAYRDALLRWLEPRTAQLCEDCQRRHRDNPLRVLDCKVEADRALLAEAPRLDEYLCTPCRDHFSAVCRALDDYGVAHRIDARLVRGLDYYERTVFELSHADLGAQSALLGGGRYDGLVQALGGPAVPGFGFAVGLERLMLLLPPDLGQAHRTDAAIIPLGAEALHGAHRLADHLRREGLSVLVPLTPRPLGAQLRRADRSRARFAVFVGGAEQATGKFGVKDLDSGEQQTLDEPALLAQIKGDPRR